MSSKSNKSNKLNKSSKQKDSKTVAKKILKKSKNSNNINYNNYKERIYIEISLVFCELHASEYEINGIPLLNEFNILDTTILCIQDCYNGIHSIYPVTFSPSNFCLVNVMIHSQLINFKFIPAPRNNNNKKKTINKLSDSVYLCFFVFLTLRLSLFAIFCVCLFYLKM